MPAGKKKLNYRQKKPKLLRKSWMLRSVKKQKQTNMQKCRMQMRNYTAARKMPRHSSTKQRKKLRPSVRKVWQKQKPSGKRSGRSRSSGQKGRSYEKYGQAAILEMIVGVLPDIAKVWQNHYLRLIKSR